MRIDIKFHTRQVSVMFDDKVIDFGLAEMQEIKDADSSIDTIKDAVIVALCREKAWNDSEPEYSVELVDCDSPICAYCANKSEENCEECELNREYTEFIGIDTIKEPVELVYCDSPICKYCALYYNKESQEDEDDCMMCQSYPGHQYFIGIECFRTLGD